MYYIARNRKDRKVPKLRDVLEKVIEQEKQKAKARREKLRNLTVEDLIKDEENYLTEE